MSYFIPFREHYFLIKDLRPDNGGVKSKYKVFNSKPVQIHKRIVYLKQKLTKIYYIKSF